ncbi:MAG: ribosomal-processing cysteine protease Prp [Spirochaetales bacterium]|nr:ribosomal-processing cysteine protease Prp [Spirochaetales bacterium]
MILVSVTMDRNGIAVAIGSIGHETGENGVVCAAVSSLLRTYAISLDRRKGVRATARAPRKGEFYCQVKKYSEMDSGWISGLSNFLMTGLELIEQDFPGNLKIVTEWSENGLDRLKKE